MSNATFILGFGETEKTLQCSIEEAIREYVASNYDQEKGYVCDDFTNKVRTYVDGIAKESRDIGDAYKKATEYPDRYSYFWGTVIGDTSYLVFILKFHHINRRHALSPDGWGVMQSEAIFYVNCSDLKK